MPFFLVKLSANTAVTSAMTIEADGFREAEQIALKRAEIGDVRWEFSGSKDDLEVDQITPF